MSTTLHVVKPASRCLRNSVAASTIAIRNRNSIRNLASTSASNQALTTNDYSESQLPPSFDPTLASTPNESVGPSENVSAPQSHGRRTNIQNARRSNVPFEKLPYQCFQEALKVIRADRAIKLKQIEKERRRISHAEALDPSQWRGGEVTKKGKLVAMRNYLEELKILADVNDPTIKMRFEDGEGDMNRPIYRYLADRQWRSYRRPILIQRVSQMNVIPDIIPYVDPTVSVELAFSQRNVQPGDFVDSRLSEVPPRLRIQCFDKGERYVTIVVVDPDVPNVEKDGFDYRCHFLAANILISPTMTSVPLGRRADQERIVMPWLPPSAQKGSPYHRLATFVLQQEGNLRLNPDKLKTLQRDEFNLRSFNDKFGVKPVGVHLFRCQYDEGTRGVMETAGIEGADLEFRRKKPEKLPYKKKDGARYR